MRAARQGAEGCLEVQATLLMRLVEVCAQPGDDGSNPPVHADQAPFVISLQMEMNRLKRDVPRHQFQPVEQQSYSVNDVAPGRGESGQIA